MKNTRRSLLLLSGLALPSLFFARNAQTQPQASAPADLPGKWTFVFDTEGGDRTFDADFKLDGKNVTGTWDKKTQVKGTFDGGQLDLEFPTTSEEVGEGTLKIAGKLTSVITGTWSFQTYSGTFTATRPKA